MLIIVHRYNILLSILLRFVIIVLILSCSNRCGWLILRARCNNPSCRGIFLRTRLQNVDWGNKCGRSGYLKVLTKCVIQMEL